MRGESIPEKEATLWDWLIIFAISVLVIAGINYYAEAGRKNTATIDYANGLIDEYNHKSNETVESASVLNTTISGTLSPKAAYVDMKNKNEELLKLGDGVELYIKDNFDALDARSYSDILAVIAKNKGQAETENRVIDALLEEYDNYTPTPTPQGDKYIWEINYYGTENGNYLGIITFENKGDNLRAVKFKFEFYKASGAFYSDKKFDVGDVAGGQIVKKKVDIPTRSYSYEVWSKEKIFVTVNGGPWEEQQLQNYE